MNVTTQKIPRKFKMGDKVTIKHGEKKGWIAIVGPDCGGYKYSVSFLGGDGLGYFYQENCLQLYDIVGEITKIFKDMHLTPISPKHREYMTGYIDSAFEYAEMTLIQRNELYKKMGIE